MLFSLPLLTTTPAKAKELGCQEPPRHPGDGFLGLKMLGTMQEADKAKLFPDLMLTRHNNMIKETGRVCTTFKSNLLGQEIYFTSDPKNIQAMLATQFQDYDLGPARRGNMIATLGDGIFVQDGKAWEHSRAMLRPNFVRDQVSDLDLEERHVQNLLRVMPVQADGWTAETDIQTLFFRLTIDSATEFLFGESVDSQLTEAPGMNIDHSSTRVKDEIAFSQNFDAAQMHMARRFRLGDMFWTHNPKEYKDNNKIVNNFISHYVDLALRNAGGLSEKKAEEGHNKEKYVFLEALAQQTRDPVEIRAQLLNILLAGRDTTASLLTNVWYILSQRPDIWAKLQADVATLNGDLPTFEQLKNLKYLKALLNESLRMHPVVPANSREALEDTTLPLGGGPDGRAPLFIPKGQVVAWSVYAMHRRTDYYGADAETFKPERWLDVDGKKGLRPGWEYLPFNGGARICLGQQFALTEASYTTVRLCQAFAGIEARDAEPWRENLTLTCVNLGGAKVALTPR